MMVFNEVVNAEELVWEEMISSTLNMMILRCLQNIQEEYPAGNIDICCGIQEENWELIWESRASRAIIEVKETGEVTGKQVEKNINIVP